MAVFSYYDLLPTDQFVKDLDLSGMIMIMAMDCASMSATGLATAGFWHVLAGTLALGRGSASERDV